MRHEFKEDTQATLTVDDSGRVQDITHFDSPVPGQGSTAQMVAQN